MVYRALIFFDYTKVMCCSSKHYAAFVLGKYRKNDSEQTYDETKKSHEIAFLIINALFKGCLCELLNNFFNKTVLGRIISQCVGYNLKKKQNFRYFA